VQGPTVKYGKKKSNIVLVFAGEMVVMSDFA